MSFFNTMITFTVGHEVDNGLSGDGKIFFTLFVIGSFYKSTYIPTT